MTINEAYRALGEMILQGKGDLDLIAYYMPSDRVITNQSIQLDLCEKEGGPIALEDAKDYEPDELVEKAVIWV